MHTNLCRVSIWQSLALGLVFSMNIGSAPTFGQSTVFMTIEPTIGSSRLAGFNGTTPSYEVDDGVSGVYYGVTNLNGDVLVADLSAHLIQRFSTNGSYLGTFGSSSVLPGFLETDSSGNVYSTPFVTGSALATRMNSAGVVSQTFSGLGRFNGIDADAAGNVYIAQENKSAYSLRKYASDGTFLNSTPLTVSNPLDVAIDEVGNRLYLADEGSGIKVFDISGAAPVLTGSITAPASAIFAGVHYAPESGHVFAVDWGFSSGVPRALEYTAGGTFVRQYKPTSQFHAWDVTTMASGLGSLVPEPSSVALLAMATVGIVLNGRKSRRKLQR